MGERWVAVLGAVVLGIGCSGSIGDGTQSDSGAGPASHGDNDAPGDGDGDQQPGPGEDGGTGGTPGSMDADVQAPVCVEDGDCDDDIDCTLDRCAADGLTCEHTAVDLDADGHGSSACLDSDGTPIGDDCNDDALDQNPSQQEFCDGVDNDCDGATDEEMGAVAWYADDDTDGYGGDVLVEMSCLTVPGASVNTSDCDDSDRDVHPGGVELCNDVDDDCDGQVDEQDVCASNMQDGGGPPDPCGGGAVNGCGGCAVLAQQPGTPCGPCGFDVYACSGQEATACDDTTYGNACAGCTVLAAAPGSACGQCGLDSYACNGTDAVACAGDTPGNACGGCEALAGAPGSACGSCGLDAYGCDGIDAVLCDGDTLANACGGCGALPDQPGDACGTCDLDVYACAGGEAVACDGDTRANACGGCGGLPDEPGDACGGCGLDVYVCNGAEDVACDGDTSGNACDGCGALPNQPGAACGSCGLDAYACSGPDSVACDGDTAGNACGGCGVLSDQPDAPCGPCGLDAYFCDSSETVACDGNTTGNACGGCSVLAQQPGEACGTCGLDAYECNGPAAVTCDGDTTVNACGGCGALGDQPGDACGSCGLDEFACNGTEAVACDGDTTVNACGGCGALSDQPGDACGSCSLDLYECSGPDAVVCDGDTGCMGGGCGTAAPSTGTGQTILVNGLQRTYVLWLPAGYDPDVAYPLVFAFHGAGSNGAQAQAYFGVQQASNNGAIVVYPDARASEGNAWVFFGNGAAADFNFFGELYDKLSSTLCVNSDRVFSTGHSSGGYFSNALGCERPDVLRAIAPVAGGGPFLGCNTGQVAAWLMASIDDGVVDWTSGEASKDHWVGANSCASSSTAVPGSAVCIEYDSCDAGYPVQWCLDDGVGHNWPSYGGSSIWQFFDGLPSVP